MSLSLTLLPVTMNLGPGHGVASHEVLVVTATPELLAAVRSVRSRKLAERLESHMGEAWGREVHEVVAGPPLVISTEPAAVVDQVSCYGLTDGDAYGKPLRWVFAEDLATLSAHKDVKALGHNRAIWAYLGALPPDARVVLYWR